MMLQMTEHDYQNSIYTETRRPFEPHFSIGCLSTQFGRVGRLTLPIFRLKRVLHTQGQFSDTFSHTVT